MPARKDVHDFFATIMARLMERSFFTSKLKGWNSLTLWHCDTVLVESGKSRLPTWFWFGEADDQKFTPRENWTFFKNSGKSGRCTHPFTPAKRHHSSFPSRSPKWILSSASRRGSGRKRCGSLGIETWNWSIFYAKWRLSRLVFG